MNLLKRGGLYLLLGVVIAATATGAYVGRQLLSPGNPSSRISSTAVNELYSTPFPDVAGKTQRIADWEGKTVVVNFWATWCPPCREEMPAFSRLQLKYANDVQFVGISVDSADNVRSFTTKVSVAYPLLVVESQGVELSKALGNERMGLPYTVVLGPKREVLLAHTGRLAENELDRILEKAGSK
ncbi:TlpA family protein disulfide reductase [Propionivibrio soli]|uniref:TlpA family protein disulfide reductase n=1 Tax=Propionivibrio soli TaxID=2976531 RepID=UPI0021E8F994|nr:TlpA disulfide reductase family protein [Propionivibrio soli]